MCGIAGILSTDGVDRSVLQAMGDAVSHRGPDGEGFLLHGRDRPARVLASLRDEPGNGADDTVGFAHRRLSIIDLSDASDQPMLDQSGRYAIAYNGELYNYVELRDRLAELGRPARTSGDTEIVLSAYAQWGPDCVSHMVGMWAFAILDLERRALFLAVDRFGIKPLFYSVAGGSLYFASEIKSLLEAPGVEPEPNEAVVRRFMLTGRVDESEQTFFTGIRRLTPAHHLTIPLERPAEARPRRYWAIRAGGYRGNRKQAASEFAERLRESVRVHLRSDVPVGTCLSGGLDSSAIVCVADELRRSGGVPRYAHHGFGYLPDDPSVSEQRFMEEVVRRTGIEMTYVKPSPERFQRALLEIVRQQDEPFGSTSIAAQWFVFEAAKREGLKVMLDGQGADEVLGGYHGYFLAIGLAHLRARRPLRYARLNRQYRRFAGASLLPTRFALAQMGRSAQAAAQPQTLPDGPVSALMTPSLRRSSTPADWTSPDFTSINAILEAHTSSLGMPSLLRFEDRNSMAHSIEARVPFLDHRLVEFAFSLPGDYKVNGVETKSVLREAMRGVLPEPIRTRRDKIGFRAEPTATWALAERNRDELVANGTRYEEDWFDRAAIDRLLGGGRDESTEFLLWRVLNTKLWLRTFWGEGAPLPA
jgi:asparagine synthase (glutamine-hydrolysing)